jgi:hypothetical protein
VICNGGRDKTKERATGSLGFGGGQGEEVEKENLTRTCELIGL